VPAHEIVSYGVALAPEGRHCFPRMTVRENLDLGAYHRRGSEVAADMDRVFALFPRLHEREKQKAGTMSGGEQQMLAIGRALMARPKLLMLDEPSMGIAPILVQRIYETIGEINRSGVTILLVEQNAQLRAGRLQARLRPGDRTRRAGQRLRPAARRPRRPARLPGDLMFLLATIGAAALYLLFIWLVSAAAAAWLAERKGYGERVGLFFGLILSGGGFLIVLLLPARPGSTWKVEGWLPNPGARRPLGIPALGPVSAADAPETLGPALSDIPPAQPSEEPTAGDDAPSAS